MSVASMHPVEGDDSYIQGSIWDEGHKVTTQVNFYFLIISKPNSEPLVVIL